ncbi:hypothetical protein MGG_17730 [Pyricularia oryzae 70-15]|uniref:F-box domain-containing protein n=1 Tax=Pyricularia oryzae (strain 70-15 / ATCC MYA-4617 / FGSC 8958) TaxID=242507 RepID=G4NH95_PYRO7|nr:uncharacterized protein MGG_17730 [Pyricularia oryzae 70-15]EHA47605.1 hypothetical protein MGG_17730 [Pyricularia oryzae 70-15]KAI7916660.1 hypothetical protein M9X92_007774 [Pyricularia oryzae]KAI7931908.1 hypothetical protein M0657_000922 [Pyricularia oryzae]
MPNSFWDLPNDILLSIFDQLETQDKAALIAISSKYLGLLERPLYRYNVRHEDASAMMWAARRGRLDTLQKVYAAGAELNDRTSSYDLDRNLAKLSPSLNRGDVEFTALHLAARAGHDRVVHWLLDNGARINAPALGLCRCDLLLEDLEVDATGHSHSEDVCFSKTPVTALHLSICFGRDSTAEILLRRGASAFPPLHTDEDVPALTAFHIAAFKGRLETLQYLVKTRPILTYAGDGLGRNALQYASLNTGDQRVVQFLVDLQLDPPDEEDECLPALECAVWNHNFEAANALIDAGETIDTRGTRFTALHMACIGRTHSHLSKDMNGDIWEQSRQELLQRLVQLPGVDLEMERSEDYYPEPYEGRTPLSLALTQPIRNVEILLEAGARPESDTLQYLLEPIGHDDELDQKVVMLLKHGLPLEGIYDDNEEFVTVFHKIVDDHLSALYPMLLDLVLDNLGPANASEAFLRHMSDRLFMRAARYPCHFDYGALARCAKLSRRGYGPVSLPSSELSQLLRLIIRNDNVRAFNQLLEIAPHILENDKLLRNVLSASPESDGVSAPGQIPLRLLGLRNWDLSPKRPHLVMAVKRGFTEVVKEMLTRGADPRVADLNGDVPIDTTISCPPHARMAVMECLVQGGADIFWRVRGIDGHDKVSFANCMVISYRDVYLNNIGLRTPITVLDRALTQYWDLTNVAKYLDLRSVPTAYLFRFIWTCVALCIVWPDRSQPILKLYAYWATLDQESRGVSEMQFLHVLCGLWEWISKDNMLNVLHKTAVEIIWIVRYGLKRPMVKLAPSFDQLWTQIADWMMAKKRSGGRNHRLAHLMKDYFVIETVEGPSGPRKVVVSLSSSQVDRNKMADSQKRTRATRDVPGPGALRDLRPRGEKAKLETNTPLPQGKSRVECIFVDETLWRHENKHAIVPFLSRFETQAKLQREKHGKYSQRGIPA